MVNNEIWAFPLSALLALALSGGMMLGYDKYRKLKSKRIYMIVTTATVALLTAVEGTFKLDLQHSAGFLLAVAVLTVLCGMEALEGVKDRKTLSYVLTHAGLFLILGGGFFGAPDFETVTMVINKEKAENCAKTADGMTVPLAFSLSLTDFRIDTYDDGISPKQYTSTIDIDGVQKTTAVNHPCLHKGWLIYQADYDRAGGSYSVLRLVRDPWLPLVFLGMAVLALGAILELRRTWHSKAVIPVILTLALIFGAISIAKINFGSLAPALRSLWFVPHLIIYMVAYSVLALALLAAVFGKGAASGKSCADGRPDGGCGMQRAGSRRLAVNQSFAAKLLGTASALLILGMLCGAVWAKVAWGDYWTWDAKECWAAVTWLLTLVGTHLKNPCKKFRFVMVILLAFLAMQVTWYGVNYLPSAENSMHTYTK